MSAQQKITTFLWFDNNAEEAMNHYVSIFNNSKVLGVTRYSATGPGPAGSVMVASFELDGVQFAALNGGPIFKFNEAISQVVHCDSQDEIDTMWSKLSEGGAPSQCGWLKDKFGLSWQIIPRNLPALLQNPDPEKAKRSWQALMKMTKIEISQLQNA